MRRAILILTGLLILMLSGCSKYEIPAPEYPDDIPVDVSFSGDVQPIFDNNCVVCHSGGQSPDLSDGWSYEEIIDGGFVNTDDPLASPIYETFSGTHDGRASDPEILTILGWIIEGAENN